MDTRSSEGLRESRDTLLSLETIASRVRADWDKVDLASPSSDHGAQLLCAQSYHNSHRSPTKLTVTSHSLDTPDETQAVYSILKTLLFSFIMIAKECLSSSLYVPASSSSASNSTNPTAVSLATLTLKTFFHLSFILSQFGGVTAGSKAFPQLQETFFLGLDIIGSQPAAAEQLISEFCDNIVDSAGTWLQFS